MTADQVIALLDLSPHPEGGWFRETFRDTAGPDGRSRCTAIFFLLRAGETSAWHRVDATEIWLHHAGASIALSIAEDGAPAWTMRLGSGLAAGERPQGIVPAGAWQAARCLGDESPGDGSLGGWSLVTCTVAPGFDFAGFEMDAGRPVP